MIKYVTWRQKSAIWKVCVCRRHSNQHPEDVFLFGLRAKHFFWQASFYREHFAFLRIGLHYLQTFLQPCVNCGVPLRFSKTQRHVDDRKTQWTHTSSKAPLACTLSRYSRHCICWLLRCRVAKRWRLTRSWNSDCLFCIWLFVSLKWNKLEVAWLEKEHWFVRGFDNFRGFKNLFSVWLAWPHSSVG